MNDIAIPTVDDGHPWLGLASFTEDTQGYFYGREDEVAELGRRVQRKLLTVLFGQSGLGKTSILRAGLVPRLRGHGFCPVYVRIGYGHDAPEPAEQIKQAIARTAHRSGEWTRAGIATEGETLWEYLHHRDDVLRDETGNTLIPLLIFDQFEEIFTIAQSDEFGRARATRFITDLADLVENRPPRSLEAKLDADDSTTERFDFARSDYRVLIALREDYLAPLEGLKNAMPSITQNRLRLAPMTGTQALAAVLRPGKNLVTDEVAAAIVRFVAGGAELGNAEVEPSLLSLICRELNDTRVAQGRREISLDLLAGSHASILSNFYERALADQLPEVRRIIEDELLTESGFRENVAEERLVGSFTAAGATPDTLAVLVNRRLLRIEERLDVRRAELTHDVLCGVVKSSRDLRQERESREGTERLLAEQRNHEQSTRRALVRARQVAAGCVVLALGAVLAAVLAYWSTQRAHRAEHLAEQSRRQAEQLLGYLTEDFARELEGFGRLDVVADLAKREIDYFHALPAELQGPDTIRTGAVALVQYAKAKRLLGDPDAAAAADREALTMLTQRQARGDVSESTTIALARGMIVRARILYSRQDPAAVSTTQQAADLLKPFTDVAHPSIAAQYANVEALGYLGYLQFQDPSQATAAVHTLQSAMQSAADWGQRDLSNVHMAAQYAEAGAWLVGALSRLGRNEEAKRVGADAGEVAAKVLKLRPGFLLALHAQEVIQSFFAEFAMTELRPLDSLTLGRVDESTALMLVTLDPKNTTSLNNLANSRKDLGDASWALGNLRESLHYYQAAITDMQQAKKAGVSFALNQLQPMAVMAWRLADIGDFTAADSTLIDVGKFVDEIQESAGSGSILALFAEGLQHFGQEGVALAHDSPAAARQVGAQIVPLLKAVEPRNGQESQLKFGSIFYLEDLKGEAEYLLGDFVASAATLRDALDAHTHLPTASDDDRRGQAEVSTPLALALAGQHHNDDARRIIGPVVAFHRELAARNHGDQQQRVELALALYAQALVDWSQRRALLREAVGLIDSTPTQIRALHSTRVWRGRIRSMPSPG